MHSSHIAKCFQASLWALWIYVIEWTVTGNWGGRVDDLLAANVGDTYPGKKERLSDVTSLP